MDMRAVEKPNEIGVHGAINARPARVAMAATTFWHKENGVTPCGAGPFVLSSLTRFRVRLESLTYRRFFRAGLVLNQA